MISVGIDLALNEIGICVLENGSVREIRTINLSKIKSIHDKCRELVWQFGWEDFVNDLKENKRIEIYCEVGNHGNAAMTQRFAYVAGYLKKEFEDYIVFIKPNQWFELFAKDKNIKLWSHLKREERKKESMEQFMLENKYIPNDFDDNMADAYWIAKYGPRIETDFFKVKVKKEKPKWITTN